MAPNTSSATPEQIETLLDFLEENKDLAHGRLRSLDGKVKAKRLWRDLCNKLNSMGGCTKTIRQWQRVWFDRKYLAKKAAAGSRRSASATGGGPSTASQLSLWEQKVMSIMGDGFGERQTEARVPSFDMTTETKEPTTSQRPSFTRPNSADIIELPPFSPLASQPVSPEILTSEHSSQSSRSRSQSASSSSLSSRLIDMEEKRAVREEVRNNELAGIRAALLQLCELMKEYINKK